MRCGRSGARAPPACPLGRLKMGCVSAEPERGREASVGGRSAPGQDGCGNAVLGSVNARRVEDVLYSRA